MQGEKRFIDSNFANADLRQADLSNMIMLTTNMEGADLRGANLSHIFLPITAIFEMQIYVVPT